MLVVCLLVVDVGCALDKIYAFFALFWSPMYEIWFLIVAYLALHGLYLLVSAAIEATRD